MSEIFYAVWRKSGGGAQSKRHENKLSAKTEASRLAQQTNEDYYILKVIGKVSPVTLEIQYTQLR